jgi:peptidoglycan/xylan/chitin deacetylase (PgdA/CDA1 family)/GT2 family glycosyltransferase/predicted TPR repeat methyltransferase
MTLPAITFLVPAYNASGTLTQCLGSLRDQTYANWQAIVVDDGSTDDTFEVAAKLSAADPRIVVARQDNKGAAAARNHAASLAGAPFFCMLDADDWIAPDFIECMLPRASGGDRPAIAYCSYRRVTPEGRALPVDGLPDLSGDGAKREFSSYCALVIHSAVFPRSLFDELGGMDTSLATCEDWDLWLRMAFRGAKFHPVAKCLASYRMRSGSLSRDPMKLVRDAVTVTTRAANLRRGDASEEMDADYPLLEITHIRLLAWFASSNLGDMKDLASLAAHLPTFPNVAGYEGLLAEVILHGLKTGLMLADQGEVLDRIDDWVGPVTTLVDYLEERSMPGVARKLWEALAWSLSTAVPRKSFVLTQTLVDYLEEQSMPGVARKLCKALAWSLSMAIPRKSFVLKQTFAVSVELTKLALISRPPDADTLILHIHKRGKHLATVAGPVWGDLSIRSQVLLLPSISTVLRAAIPNHYAWKLMNEARIKRSEILRILRRPGRRRRRLRQMIGDIQQAAIVQSVPGNTRDNEAQFEALKMRVMAALPPENIPVKKEAGEAVVTPTFKRRKDYWEAIFEKPDPWDYLSIYEQVKYDQTLSLIPRNVEHALELACAEGIFSEKLSRHVGYLTATDISSRAIERAKKRCGHCSNAEFWELDFVSGALPGEQDLIVCSEVLYYMRDIPQLTLVCEKMAAALKPNGCILTAHARLRCDEPGRTGFDWNHPFGGETIRQTFENIPGLSLEKTVETELYAVHLFRKGEVKRTSIIRQEYGRPLQPSVAKLIIWGPEGVARGAASNSETTSEIPVLMYHRIADEGPASLLRYRTTPEDFRKQLQFLRRQGFYGLNSAQLCALLEQGKPIRGRPVLITFDDAYEDFATNAYPILEENNFSADVFVVTSKVGGHSDWDRSYGEPAKLMDWDQIGTLHSKGVSFGSHLATHKPASSLEGDMLAVEALQSRCVLVRRLGEAVNSIALPYGIADLRVPATLEKCGYEIAFTTRQAKASLQDNLLSLPRLEVRGDRPLTDFATLLGLGGAFVG